MDRRKIFGRRLKQLREDKKLSQEKLAAMLHSKRTYISELERGLRNVSLEFIWHIADTLQIHPALFFLSAHELRKFKIDPITSDSKTASLEDL